MYYYCYIIFLAGEDLGTFASYAFSIKLKEDITLSERINELIFYFLLIKRNNDLEEKKKIKRFCL